jgi:glycosyltransferase involved in cell wall biosynthesis
MPRDDGRRPGVLFLGRGGPVDGQQRQLLYLADGLARHGVSMSVALSEPGPIEAELASRRIDVRVARMSSWRSLLRFLRRAADADRLLRLARETGAGVVHAHDVWRAGYARHIAAHASIPCVVHVRGPLSPRDIGKHRLLLADAIIAIADRYVDDLIAAGIDPKRVHLVDDAVDTELFSPARADPDFIRRSLALDGLTFVGLVGRIGPFKRVREFLEIAAALPADVARSTRFVIVGEVEDHAYAKALREMVARHGLGKAVKFVGRYASAMMPAVLSALDLLVTLSGGSIMFEAMAMRRPVLSIRADGRHSRHTIHGETAWCVDSEAPPVAAAALARLLADAGLRDRLGEAGRARVDRHLSTGAMVAKVEAIYRGLWGGPRPSRTG